MTNDKYQISKKSIKSKSKQIVRGICHFMICLSFVIWVLSFSPSSYINAQDGEYYVENSSPAQISIFPPYAFPPGLNTVRGARLNLLYGDIRNVYGLDCGLVQRASGNVDAIQVGAVNITGDTRPLQCAVVNDSDSMTGLQIGLFNFTGELSGIQIGLINKSRSRTMPLFNWSD